MFEATEVEGIREINLLNRYANKSLLVHNFRPLFLVVVHKFPLLSSFQNS